MPLQTKHIENLFNEGYSLPDLLPYIEYAGDVFILADGSLGKIWKITPWEVEGKEDPILSALAGHLENLLTRIPTEKLACQIILTSDRNVNDKLQEYYSCTHNDFLLGNISPPLVGGARGGVGGKNIQLYFTLRFFPEWIHSSFWQKTFSALQSKNTVEAHIEAEMQRHREVFGKHSALIEGIFQSAGIAYTAVEGHTLARWLYGILNPKRSRMIPRISFHDEEPIRDQVLFHIPESTQVGFVLEGMHTRVISLKELPPATTTAMFTKEFYDGNRFCLLDIPQDFMMVVNFTVPGLNEALGRLQMQKSFAFMHQENWLGDKSIEAVEKKKELDDTIAHMFKGGGKIINARIHWVIRAESPDDADAGADVILSGLSRCNCEGLKEDLIGASLFLTCLPLNFDPYYEQFIRRVKRLASGNMADMLPVYGSFRGTKTAAQMYSNRRGELVFLDFFDSNINPHGVVIGASGAGKSFFINDFILQNERLGAHFFVLDKGDSYKKLCSILNGQYTAFDLNHPVTINPFVNDPTPENLSFLLSLLSQMASGGDERDRLTREEEGLLHKAVLKAYEAKINGVEVTLSQVVTILKDNDFNDKYGINSLMGPTLALRLTPFTQKGPYGGFFDGVNQFKIEKRFTVFELADLSAYPDLQMAVLLNLMFFMTTFVSSPALKPKRKYLLIDEAWSLLKVKNTADFITNAFKTFRKYRCSVVAITQEMADLTRQESGIAIVANTSNKIFLKQEASLIDLLKEKLSLNAGIIQALKTVETVKGKYSEGFVITDTSCGIIRLVPDPFLYWAANSEPRNNEYLFNKAQECGGNLIEAIKICAKEHPYGIL